MSTTKPLNRGSERLDILKTPVQVCLLPLMDAAVQFSLMSAMTVAASKTRPPIVTIDVNGTTDGRPMTASYQLDMENRSRPLNGVGLLWGRTTQTQSTLKRGGGGSVSDRVGKATSSLSYTVEADRLSLSGRIGRVAARLEFRQVVDGGRVQGFVAQGTLGGEAFSLDARLFGIERKNIAGRPSHLESEFHVRGMIGEQPIVKLYQMTSMGLPNGEELLWTGEGRVGDHLQFMAVTLSITSG